MKMHAWGLYRFVTALSMTFCYVSSIQFSACQDARKNNFCNMTCETADFQQTIDFKCNGTSRGSCVSLIGCSANLYQESPNKTIFTISSLSYSNDIGNWTCSYGTTDAQSQYFIVYGNASTPNITKYDPPVNSVDVESVELTAVLECAYPATPSIILEFDEEGKGIYKTFKNVQPSVSAPTLGQCSDNLESIVTAEVKASYDENDQALAGKTVHLRVKFFYNTNVEFITPGLGEYTFKLDCTGSFHCGFWLLMLVVASSITICILIQLKVKIFGGFSIVKIIIIVIFSVVAIGIGLGLGLGLRKGGGNCLDCGATIGISISLGVALSVIQFIVIIKCDKGKGCDGNSKGETDRSNGDRARTPASTTGINLETKKKSQNKPTEKGTEASSLTAKTFGQPLPDTPNARKHQLEPLKTDSFEVENSTTEKKKKKKRKKKKEASEGNEASEEKEERPELEF